MSQAVAASWMQGPSATVKRGADGAHGSAPPAKQGAKGSKKKEKGDLQAALLKVITKLRLNDAREMANLAGAVYQTWETTETANHFTQIMIDAGLKYDEVSKNLKERQQAGEDVDSRARGPPHVQVWGALAMSLANQIDTFLDGSETYKESEKKVFYEYFQKHLAQKLPTDVAKHEKKGRLTFAFSYDEPGREARSLSIQFLNSDKGKATQLREAARLLAIFEKGGGKDKDQDQ
ncbi:unnamed protein product [Prorocentrum cordatum]|uniref:MAGE domain-containing protein n=1 Tax=Prorocentrum cordatum TaxID=2364126 RepID=A0ABN9S3R4_9DINO|nr:unnamed protein product [Polarella glacialis]